MALSEITRQLVESKLRKYCQGRVPAQLGFEVSLGFKIRGDSVTLYEQRTAFGESGRLVEIPVAQIRFNSRSKKWTLYCADRNSRWEPYLETDPTSNLDALLREVDKDPTGIFWG